MNFDVIPAIDLREGRVVRLRQGDYGQQTIYGSDPAELARRYLHAGARWLHLVDLDGARSGDLENLPTIRAIAAEGIQVQAGGGVRTEDDLRRLFDVGVDRVVLGSVAIREPERVARWLATYGSERITIALDTRRVGEDWLLPSAGWTAVESRTLDELAPWYASHGARHLLCTDIDRDGMLAGFNLDLYRHLANTLPQLAVQASGGVRSLVDIRAARDEGADELVFYDITASPEGRSVDRAWVERVARVIDIPFCVAGGIRSVDEARAVLYAGADKISVNSPALERPELINELADAFGVQCVVVGIDSLRDADGQWRVRQYTGDPGKTQALARGTLDWMVEAQRRGAGEIVLNCMGSDGVRQGYDLEQLRAARAVCHVPLIASGGAGAPEHFRDVFLDADVDGALAASVFHSGAIAIPELKQYLQREGVAVRR